jgi:farnesyl-diphosphate farnesyltransferase
MVTTHTEGAFLYPLLKSVSRSFYLSLAVLPSDVRPQLSVAYLYARAADSIADTTLLPRPARLHYLGQFRRWALEPQANTTALREIQEALSPVGPQSEERALLERLSDCALIVERFIDEDQSLIRHVTDLLTRGMEMDLQTFPGESAKALRALQTLSDLDHYIYHVAGCVGDFWTRLICLHRPAYNQWDVEAMALLGICFGKGLQLTNVLRDMPKDLRRGRCYIPEAMLSEVGLTPGDLLRSDSLPRFRPVLSRLLSLALEHLDKGWLYTMAIPLREWRVRLACVWPILFALKTLSRVSVAAHLFDPDVTIKMTRREVYGDLGLSAFALPSNRLLTGYYGHLKKRVAC